MRGAWRPRLAPFQGAASWTQSYSLWFMWSNVDAEAPAVSRVALLGFQTQMLLDLRFHERFEKLCSCQLECRQRRILETGLQNLSYLLSTQGIGKFMPSSGNAQRPTDPLEIAAHRDDVPEVLILVQTLDK